MGYAMLRLQSFPMANVNGAVTKAHTLVMVQAYQVLCLLCCDAGEVQKMQPGYSEGTLCCSYTLLWGA